MANIYKIGKKYQLVIPKSIREKALLKAKYNLKTPDAIQIASAIYSKYEEFTTSDKQLAKVREIKLMLYHNQFFMFGDF